MSITNLPPLSVQLLAKLDQFELGMNKAGRLADQSLGQIQRSFDRLDSVGKTLGRTLAATFSVGVVAGFVNRTIDGLDALNDLKDATGASIENLSALEDVGARTGTQFESVSSILVKFNKVLSESKPGNEASNTLKALGLEAEKLKQLDPAEALQKTAEALAGYADNGNKARITQELFGKSVREAAPFLKDLAEQGKLNATVTTAQAQAAEDFNKQMSRLSKSATDVARSFLSDLLPTLNKFFDTLRDAKAEGAGGSLLDGILGTNVVARTRAEAVSISASIALTTDRVERLKEELSRKGGSDEFLETRIAKARERLAALQAQAAGTTAKLKSLADIMDGGPKKPTPTAGDKPSLPGLPGKTDYSEAEKDARALADAEEQGAKDSAEAWSFYDQMQLRESKASLDAKLEMYQQWFKSIDDEQDRAIEEGAAFLEDKSNQVSEFWLQAQRNIQDALGSTIRDSLDGDIDHIRDRWKDLLKDLVAQALAANLNEALFGKSQGNGGTGGSNGGVDWGSVFGSVLSAFGGGRASGGPVSAGGMYEINEQGIPEVATIGDRDFLMMGSKSGQVTPLRPVGNSGTGGGAGAQQINNNFHYDIQAGMSSNEVMAALQRSQEATKAWVEQTLRKAGVK